MYIYRTILEKDMTDIRAPLAVGQRPALADSMKSFMIMIFVWCIIEAGRFAYEAMAVIRKLQAGSRQQRGFSAEADTDTEKVLTNIKDFIRSSYFVTGEIPILSVLILFSEWRSKIVLDGSPNTSDPVFVPLAVVVCIQAAFLFFSTCENATLNLINLAIQALSKLSIVIMVVMIIARIFEAKKAEAYVAPSNY